MVTGQQVRELSSALHPVFVREGHFHLRTAGHEAEWTIKRQLILECVQVSESGYDHQLIHYFVAR